MMTFKNMSSGDNLEKAGFVLFVVLGVLPLALGFFYALLYSFGLIGILKPGFTMAYWLRTFHDSEIVISFFYSLYIALCSIIISVILALILYISLEERMNKGFISYLIYLPLTIPAMVAAFLVDELMSGSGFLSRIAYQTGIIHNIHKFPGLTSDPYGIGIITAHVLMASPFFALIFFNISRNQRLPELADVAKSLGADNLRSLIAIRIPVLLIKSFPAIVLYFIFALGSYEIPLLLGRDYPSMISVLTIRKLRKFNLDTIPEAYIIAILYIILVVALLWYLFMKKRWKYEI